METDNGINARHARKMAAKARDRRNEHLEDVSMDVLQFRDVGSNAARTIESTPDVRPKPDLQWI